MFEKNAVLISNINQSNFITHKNRDMGRLFTIIVWLLRIIAALILLQTLFFKFSAAPESVYIFSKIHMEPYGRIGIGILELIAGVLLLIPATTVIGAALGVALMAGAIFFHLTILGIDVQGDGGQLFVYALLVLISCSTLLIIHRNDLSTFGNRIARTLKI